MLPSLVDDAPPALLLVVVVTSRFGLDDGVLGGESVSGKVFLGSGECFERNDIRLDNRVIYAIDHRVNPDAEHMLVVMRVDIRGDQCAVGSGLSVLVDIDRQDTSEADLKLDAPILVEVVIPDILCED